MNEAPWQWKTFCPAFARVWNGFFHAPVELRVVGCLRIVYAAIVLVNAAAFFPYLEMWFGEAGVFPRSIAAELSDPQQLSLFHWLPATEGVLWTGYTLFVVHAVLLLVGYCPRINALGTYVWLLSFQHRSQFLWDGEDQVMRLVGFYLLFMPLHRIWAWDWRLRPSASAATEPISGWGLRLLQLQMCIIFLDTAGSKLHGSMWQDGTALYYASRLDDFFCPDCVPHFLYNTPWIVRLLTWSVLALEFCVPVLVWFKETRRTALIAAVVFHLGCMVSMNLFLFHPIMLCGWMAFLTREDFEWLGRCCTSALGFRSAKACAFTE